MRKFLSIFTIGVFVFMSTVNIDALDKESPIPAYKHSVNICSVALIFGMFAVNYEYLVEQRHGFMARFDYSSKLISDLSMEAESIDFMLNYRWHLSEGFDSVFLGIYARNRAYKEENAKFDFKIDEVFVGLNAGKKWIWNSGFSIAIGAGYGLSQKTFKEKVDHEEALYGEISTGYAF